MHARMIHSHSGETTPIPYGKQGQVSCSHYFMPTSTLCHYTTAA